MYFFIGMHNITGGWSYRRQLNLVSKNWQLIINRIVVKIKKFKCLMEKVWNKYQYKYQYYFQHSLKMFGPLLFSSLQLLMFATSICSHLEECFVWSTPAAFPVPLQPNPKLSQIKQNINVFDYCDQRALLSQTKRANVGFTVKGVSFYRLGEMGVRKCLLFHPHVLITLSFVVFM